MLIYLYIKIEFDTNNRHRFGALFISLHNDTIDWIPNCEFLSLEKYIL